MDLIFFLKEFKDITEIESQLSGDEKLSDLEQWDSLAALGVMALADRHGKELTAEELTACQTVNDIYQVAFGDQGV
jgi:acyl carrier protein